MPNLWFAADTHFGHGNIIKNCGRPFADADEMDAALIANWNAVVAPKDEVRHLGDFAWSKDPKYLARIFDQLNGSKHLIVGNHDHGPTRRLPWASVDKLKGVKVDGSLIVLCHYGMRVWPKSHFGSLHLYGHSHGNLPGTRQSCDVGVDCWDFRPVSISEIRLRLEQTPEPGEAATPEPEDQPGSSFTI